LYTCSLILAQDWKLLSLSWKLDALGQPLVERLGEPAYVTIGTLTQFMSALDTGIGAKLGKQQKHTTDYHKKFTTCSSHLLLGGLLGVSSCLQEHTGISYAGILWQLANLARQALGIAAPPLSHPMPIATAVLWVRIQFSKIRNARHKQRNGQHTLAHQQKYT
jgi:hypothetical protein